jgi:hypothetical protein
MSALNITQGKWVPRLPRGKIASPRPKNSVNIFYLYTTTSIIYIYYNYKYYLLRIIYIPYINIIEPFL